MQGNLQEIDMGSILQILELGQRSGTLWVETQLSDSELFRRTNKEISFNCFFVNGKITYAGKVDNNSLERLKDYLCYYKVAGAIDDLPYSEISRTTISEYGCLWLLLQKQIISSEQLRSIINKMIQETLFELLSFKRGFFYFGECRLTPEIALVEVSALVKKTLGQLNEWKQFYPYIKSPLQCPVIKDEDSLLEVVSPNTYNRLSAWTDGKTSISQMGRFLNQDFVTIGQALYPHIQKGLLELIEPTPPAYTTESIDLAKVLVINKDPNTTIALNCLVNSYNCEISVVQEAFEAWRLIFQNQPDLIMCDLPLMEVDGYEICRMLRNSKKHRHIPWIMLVSGETFQQQLRGNLLGVTDYLNKPFSEYELLSLVDKHLSYKGTVE